jgi:hypothetical protein
MFDFPENEVYQLARRCNISHTDAQWLSRLGKTSKDSKKPNSSSNGACVRLGLLAHKTRNDTSKIELNKKVVQRFLYEASKQAWYRDWCEWILRKNMSKNNEVDTSKLPSISGPGGFGIEEIKKTNEPMESDVEHAAEALQKIGSEDEFNIDINVGKEGESEKADQEAANPMPRETEIEEKNDFAENQIRLDPRLDNTEKETLIKSRRGQGRFRKEVIRLLGSERCAVTGSSVLLAAFHIKPWADCDNQQRLDPYNGFLLSPTYDKAFDYGYITFSDDGTIVVHDRLSDDDISRLGIRRDARINGLQEGHKMYLRYHRNKFFSGADSE